MSNEEIIELLSEQRARGISLKLPQQFRMALRGHLYMVIGFSNCAYFWWPFEQLTDIHAQVGHICFMKADPKWKQQCDDNLTTQ